MALTPTETREPARAASGTPPKRFLGQNFLVDGNIVRKSLELARIVAGRRRGGDRPGPRDADRRPPRGRRRGLGGRAGPHAPRATSRRASRRGSPGRCTSPRATPSSMPLAGLPGARAAGVQGRRQPPLRHLDPVDGRRPLRAAALAHGAHAPARGGRPLRRRARAPKSFGAISIFLQAAYDIAPGHRVSAACFHPRPDVDSALLHLVRGGRSPIVFTPGAQGADPPVLSAAPQADRGRDPRGHSRPAPANGWNFLAPRDTQPPCGPKPCPCRSGSELAFERVRPGLKAAAGHPPSWSPTPCSGPNPHSAGRRGDRAARAQDVPPSARRAPSTTASTRPRRAPSRWRSPSCRSSGGDVHDTKNVVTFRDSFGLQVSVGAFVHDATQRWELSTRGIKDYLIYFFANFVLRGLQAASAPVRHPESAGYSADFLDGSLFTYILLPGRLDVRRPAVFGGGRRPARGEARQPDLRQERLHVRDQHGALRAGDGGHALHEDDGGGGPDPAQAAGRHREEDGVHQAGPRQGRGSRPR